MFYLEKYKCDYKKNYMVQCDQDGRLPVHIFKKEVEHLFG